MSYLSRQSRRNLKLLTTYANDKRYMGVGNFLDRRNRSYFGLKFSYETIPNQLLPFDYETFAAYPGTVEAVVTNLNTGGAGISGGSPEGRPLSAAPGHLCHSADVPGHPSERPALSGRRMRRCHSLAACAGSRV